MASQGPKFVRKGGRVIPISSKKNTREMNTPKPKVKKSATKIKKVAKFKDAGSLMGAGISDSPMAKKMSNADKLRKAMNTGF